MRSTTGSLRPTFACLCQFATPGAPARSGGPAVTEHMAVEQSTVASAAHAFYAFDTLCNHLFTPGTQLHPPGFDDVTCPLFVSWHTVSRGDSRLRGCIGTLEPRPLHSAVRDYALTSALRDRRFSPIDASELPHLRCTVSLLSGFQPAASWEDWEIGTHGLIIEFIDPHSGSRRTATFLPEVAAHEGWDKQQTLDHLIRKAGYSGAGVVVRGSASLKVTRYLSTTFSLMYDQYNKLKQEGGRELRKLLRKQQPLVTVSAAQ